MENLPLKKMFKAKIPHIKPLTNINPFSTNISLLYPLKTSEILKFSDAFRVYKNRTLVENRLKNQMYSKSTLSREHLKLLGIIHLVRTQNFPKN